MLYVVGRVVDLEYSLRCLAKATEKATYGVAMAKRVAAAKENLKKISAAMPKPEIQEIMTIADGVALKLNNEAAIMDEAEKISTSQSVNSSPDRKTFLTDRGSVRTC